MCGPVFTTARRLSPSPLAPPLLPPTELQFVAGEGGLPKAVLTHNDGSSAEVYLFGATVTSWKLG